MLINKTDRSSSVELSDQPATPAQNTLSNRQSSSQKRHRPQEKMKALPSLKKNLASRRNAQSVRPRSRSSTQSRPCVSRSDGNVFYRIREQFRAGSLGGEGANRDSASLAISQSNDPSSRSTPGYARYEGTIQMARAWIPREGTAEEPRFLVAPRTEQLSRTMSRNHSQSCPESSQPRELTRMISVLVPTIETQSGGTGPFQGESRRRGSSSSSRRLLDNSKSQLSLVGSQRSQTVLSSRSKTPSQSNSQSRPIQIGYIPPNQSSGPGRELEQECFAAELPILDSEDSLFGDGAGLSSQANMPDSRFMTPIVTERHAIHSDQSILSDTMPSQVGSSVSEIDDAHLEELVKEGRLGRKRESRSRKDATAARRKREEEEARKRRRPLSYWKQRQEEQDREIAQMAREEKPSKLNKPRVKVPWSLKETRRLVRLWEQHPNEWAKIERLDRASDHPQLTTRTQVDLKDKMRNVKISMLKKRIQLSAKWARITLTTAQKRAVANAHDGGRIPRKANEV